MYAMMGYFSSCQ